MPFELDAPRVYTVLKLDERRDKAQTLEDKIDRSAAPDRQRRATTTGGVRKCPGRDSNPQPPRGQRF